MKMFGAAIAAVLSLELVAGTAVAKPRARDLKKEPRTRITRTRGAFARIEHSLSWGSIALAPCPYLQCFCTIRV